MAKPKVGQAPDAYVPKRPIVEPRDVLDELQALQAALGGLARRRGVFLRQDAEQMQPPPEEGDWWIEYAAGAAPNPKLRILLSLRPLLIFEVQGAFVATF